MNVRALILAAIGAGVAISAGVIAYSLIPGPDSAQFDPPALDFDYSMNFQLKDALSDVGVSMSSPLKVSKAFAIQKYCTFFDDPQKQGQVEYCTSTELLDEDGHFLGNVHMVGTPENPKLVITILEASFGEVDRVATVFDTVIDNTVCGCWEEQSPGGFAATSDWVEALKEFHQQAVSQTTTRSSVLTLGDLNLQAEVTSIEGALVWKLFVAK